MELTKTADVEVTQQNVMKEATPEQEAAGDDEGAMEAIMEQLMLTAKKNGEVVREAKAPRRRQNIVLPPEPVRADDTKSLVNRGQKWVMFNVAGPGAAHCPIAEMACYRILGCFQSENSARASLKAIYRGEQVKENVYLAMTHTPVPLMESGPVHTSQDHCFPRVEKMMSAYETYIKHVDTEFMKTVQHPETRADRNVVDDGKLEAKLPETLSPADEDDEFEDSNVKQSMAQAVAVVAHVPDATGGPGTDPNFSEPLVAVMSTHATVKEAEEYVTRIHGNYQELQLYVVDTCQWIFPSLLNGGEGLKIPSRFDSSQLQELIRVTGDTKAKVH